MAIQNDGIPVGALPVNSGNNGIPAAPAYFAANPDVAAAYANRANDPNLASTVNMTPDQFAATHFQNFGSTEQRAVPTSSYEQMVHDAYGSIGRTGMGDAASNIDQAGFDYWVDTLKSGASTPEAFNRNFQTAVADYLTTKPEDQYSSYVTNFLTETKPAAVSGIVDLYQDMLGRAPDAAGLGNLYKQFGSSVDDAEREQFRQSTAAEINKQFGVGSDVPSYFQQNPDVAAAYANRLSDPNLASTVNFTPDQFAQNHYEKFGAKEGRADLNTSGILAGFKYAKESGISEDKLKKTLGEDLFNTYKTGFADYAKTGIANILADKQLSFDEARAQVKFGRDYGYDAQKLADLTGTNKKVFDAIYKNYDDTTNRVVDSVLGAENVKTDADRISRVLALQKQYGFTDEDVAKASDYDVAKLKADLAPIRNFDSDYKKIIENPKLNLDQIEDQMKTFLGASLQNPYINQKLGDKFQPVLDELNRPPRERILSQIDQQREAIKKEAGGNAGQYYRGVFGNPEVMANVLEKKGVKSLGDIVQKDKYEATPAQKRYFAPDGSRVDDLGNGTFGVPDAEGGYSSSIPKSQVTTKYGRTKFSFTPDGEPGFTKFIEIPKSELDKDGNYQKVVGKVAFNKRTGEEISDVDGVIAGQNSSGGLNKKWNTLNVQFAKNGVPLITASSEKTGLGGLVQKLAPMISMALPFVLPGLGAGLSSMLPGAGVAASGATAAIAPTLMNQALTQGIISGGLTTLGGGQFEKGFLSGAVNPVINTGIGALLPAGLSDNATNAIRGAGTNVLKGLVQGESFEDLLGQGVLSGLTNYGLGETTKGLNLTPQQVNFATGIALPLIQGKKVNPINAIGALAQMGQPQNKKGNSNLDFGGGGEDIDALMGGGDVGGGDFYDGNDSGNLGYNQPLDQQSLNNALTGNGPSNFYGANMTGNSNDQSLIAQLGQMISKGVPLSGGYIKPARVGSGYGARWSKQFNEGGMVNADQQKQRTTS